jgi:hypothetical protein
MYTYHISGLHFHGSGKNISDVNIYVCIYTYTSKFIYVNKHICIYTWICMHIYIERKNISCTYHHNVYLSHQWATFSWIGKNISGVNIYM